MFLLLSLRLRVSQQREGLLGACLIRYNSRLINLGDTGILRHSRITKRLGFYRPVQSNSSELLILREEGGSAAKTEPKPRKEIDQSGHAMSNTRKIMHGKRNTQLIGITSCRTDIIAQSGGIKQIIGIAGIGS